MADFKIDNNKLLRAFLWYQLIEIAFIILYFTICSLFSLGQMDGFWRVTVFFLSKVLINGIVFQIIIFIISWAICNLIGKRLWNVAKVVVYLCLDIIGPYCVLIIGYLMAGVDAKSADMFERCIMFLPIFILISKVAFFKFYKKRFALQDC